MKEKLIQIFREEAGLVEDEDSVYFGETLASYVPDGLEAVMRFHCEEVDAVLKKLPKGEMQEIELFATRGFTMQEYQALFDLDIKERDFFLHPAFRSLWIQTESQRRKLIYSIQKQKFNDYWHLLSHYLARFNPFLLTFFFRSHPVC